MGYFIYCFCLRLSLEIDKLCKMLYDIVVKIKGNIGAFQPQILP